ncbi:unnamed protein product [Fusarium graminearum]|uniref:Uncharacterized protein n=1 Tax=Gibberella zeae TaxID=5518 RepID=A0A4U9FGI7_GIBZA|nr:unnamed protein product [Fusarium graminearum]CAG1965957.1 unnamed protein product [Fusarium graminearum]VTO93050.1 unnamed protein product [Fusarium graminearum]
MTLTVHLMVAISDLQNTTSTWTDRTADVANIHQKIFADRRWNTQNRGVWGLRISCMAHHFSFVFPLRALYQRVVWRQEGKKSTAWVES